MLSVEGLAAHPKKTVVVVSMFFSIIPRGSENIQYIPYYITSEDIIVYSEAGLFNNPSPASRPGVVGCLVGHGASQ